MQPSLERSAPSEALVLAGASGHARVLIDLIEKQGVYRLEGLLHPKMPAGEYIEGYPVIGKDADLADWCQQHGIPRLLIAIGDNWKRAQVWKKLQAQVPQLEMGVAIHPTATLGKGTEIGPGTVIMAGAILNAGCRIGAGCLVNTGAIIEHDCVLEDFSSVAPGAILGGGCRIGNYSAIGLGTYLIHGIHVGPHSVVGAGSLVLSGLPPHVVAFGNPARVVRKRETGEGYL